MSSVYWDDLDLPLPQIGCGSVEEQLRQIQSYLYRLAEQLRCASGAQQAAPLAVREEAPRQEEPAKIFSSLKSLIIKSADIVDAYCQEIHKRLDGEYTAVSEFGSYREQTSQAITASAQATEQLFAHHARLESHMETLESQVQDVTAYIRTGMLTQQDGLPVYGVEIGQQDSRDGSAVFRRFTRLTAGRLSFFDQSDSEVAYISDRKLYIQMAVVQSLQSQQASCRMLEIGPYTLTLTQNGHLTIR